LRLPDGFPSGDAATLAATRELLLSLPPGALVLVDGLAFGAMPELAAELATRLRLVALVHHPLGLETGLEPATASAWLARERAALRHALRVVVTSAVTRDTLVAELDVAPGAITVAVPGTDPAPLAAGSRDGPPSMLAVGSVILRKDFLTLVRSVARIADLPWRLRIVGSLQRDPAEAARLAALIEAAGLEARIRLAGELPADDLAAAYDAADLVVSSSRYEGFGMALAEALARGLPIVAAHGGAVGSWLPAEAVLLVEPGSAEALAAALRGVLGDRDRLDALRAGATRARDRLTRWPETARVVSAMLHEVLR
jgi:glycosyltransferase involved in cell wall biosynthesis